MGNGAARGVRCGARRTLLGWYVSIKLRCARSYQMAPRERPVAPLAPFHAVPQPLATAPAAQQQYRYPLGSLAVSGLAPAEA